jgi:hypothetical protein
VIICVFICSKQCIVMKYNIHARFPNGINEWRKSGGVGGGGVMRLPRAAHSKGLQKGLQNEEYLELNVTVKQRKINKNAQSVRKSLNLCCI